MATLTYVPVLDGAPYDPEPAGGGVLRVELYATEDRGGTAAHSITATRVAAGRYEFTVLDSIEGRFWPRVVWKPSASAAQQNDDLRLIDLPVFDDLVVSPEDLAKKLGLELPLTGDQRDQLADAIRAGQDLVVGYLGRPILPGTYEEIREWPAGGSWDYGEQPVIEVLSEAPEVMGGRETGRWVVRYRAGLDARDARLRPIRARVLRQALSAPEALALWRSTGGGSGAGERRISSMSVEGQSVSYQYVNPDGSPSGTGSVDGFQPVDGWPDIDRWRLRGRRVFERRGANRPVRISDVTGTYG